MALYCGIDLHSSNSVISILDEQDKEILRERAPNDLEIIVSLLSPYQEALEGIVVESTYNWYWLVDGLVGAGYRVHLANTAAIRQYEGLKHGDDEGDARWLAHMLRLGILPEGYIYPKEGRAVRDLLRKRAQLVRLKTSQVLSIQNLYTRNTGRKINGNQVLKLDEESLSERMADPTLALAAQCNLAVLTCIRQEIVKLEKEVLALARPDPNFAGLQTTPGIGRILSLTILLETGEVERFPKVGHYASYCRCVASKRMSNGKKKGEGNRKNGNKYLAWAFMEGANFAVRYNDRIRRFYQKKAARTSRIVAIKTVAHKLARACYFIMRDGVDFEVEKAFG